VNLAGMGLTSVPEQLRGMKKLTHLDLGTNRLTALPDWLGELMGLTHLDLFANQIADLPVSLGNLRALTCLNLTGNELTHIPDWLSDLTLLTELHLNSNWLTALPESIGGLRSLTQLHLKANRLSALPESVGSLASLTQLNVADNRLSTLPSQLADLVENGLDLGVTGNPLADPLPMLVERGQAALAAYLRSLYDSQPQYDAKLLLVGEGNVGKSSLVAALKSEPFVEGRSTTHGIEISALSARHPSLDVDMTVRAWDFGGQEVYRVSHQFFFTDRALYAVVWHARQGREQDEVEGWLRRIRLRIGQGARVLLVATHCAERRAEVDYSQLDRMFPGLLAGFYEVDCRTGEGIPEFRQAISEEAARLPQMGQLISPRWVAARETILARSETEPQMRYDLFTEICSQHGVSESEASALAKLMHDLGQVIYYAEDEGLRDIVILNPEWLTKAISYVLEDAPTRNSGGFLDHERVREIWSDRDDGFSPRYHRYFLRLMEKFDISYRTGESETRSLVAQLVPFKRPALPLWDSRTQPPSGIRSLTLVCHLAEPAPGLIPWLTIRHYRDATGSHWRHGVFLRHHTEAYKSEALLELLSDTELTAQVRAPSPDMYFNVLRDSIEDLIAKRWPGLEYWLAIPCPGRTSAGTRCRGSFRLDGLIRHLEKGRETVTCMNCDEAPGISALLTGFAAQSTSLTAELERMNNRLAAITSGVAGIRDQAAQIADTVRRVHRVVSTEVTDCPRLFTLLPVRGAAPIAARARVHEDHYRLTLWCEHPGDEHPWKPATYKLEVPKEWFTRIAPYAKLVCQALQLIVPLAGAVATAAVPAVQRTSAQNELKIMTTLVSDLPATVGQHDERDLAKFSGQLTAAQGEALRALRAVIFEHDHSRSFGDLRRVQTPAGDLLWVCRDHYHEYDPGLPKVSDLDSLPVKDADTDHASAVSGENDWYGGQAAAAKGASFADTGTYRLTGRILDEYGSGPRGQSFADTGSYRLGGRVLAEDEYQASIGRRIPGAPQEVSGPSGSAVTGEPGGHSGRVPVSLADAVQSAHEEGQAFGESVARDAPALWLEAVLARKPRMPSDLEARLLQGSALPIDFLLHDEVRHALRRGFWDALERARRCTG
jgi:GTPase SAR1 family protein